MGRDNRGHRGHGPGARGETLQGSRGDARGQEPETRNQA